MTCASSTCPPAVVGVSTTASVVALAALRFHRRRRILTVSLFEIPFWPAIRTIARCADAAEAFACSAGGPSCRPARSSPKEVIGASGTRGERGAQAAFAGADRSPTSSMSTAPFSETTMSGRPVSASSAGRPGPRAARPAAASMRLAVPSSEPCGQASRCELDAGAGLSDVGVVEDQRRRHRDHGAGDVGFVGPGGDHRVERGMAAPLRRAADAAARPSARRPGRCSWRPGSASTARRSPLRRRSIVAPTENGSQLVGLSAKPGRSSAILTKRVRSGIPSWIWGSGSETAVICAVSGSTCDRDPHRDHAEVVGAREGRNRDDQAQRGALVGAGQIDLAVDVDGMGPGAGAGDRRADLAGGRAGRRGLLGGARVAGRSPASRSPPPGSRGSP